MMQKLFSKFFTSDKLFLTVTVLSISFFILSAGAYLFSGLSKNDIYLFLLTYIFIAIVIAFLYSSYKRHEKNMMKGLMGLVLGILAMVHIIGFTRALDVDLFNIMSYLLSLIVDILLISNHFIINSDHHSSPKNIFANQVLIILYAVFSIADAILNMMTGFVAADYVMYGIASFFSMLAYIMAACVILCIESRLDAYRIQREANGWTPDQSR